MTNTLDTYLSWGRSQRYAHSIHKFHWLSDVAVDFSRTKQPVLAFGKGRSYGDCCLNDNGLLIDMSELRRFINFNPTTGILTCEAGVTLAEIIRVFLPRGWFPPVVPGTKIVTVGGAIANDIHGKNHHVAGTFGRYINRFALLRSDGQQYLCSPTEHSDLFNATIGGMGLTGVITWAEIQLKPIVSAKIDFENIKMNSLDQFFELSLESAADYEYTVAWIDSTAPANQLGRGIFMRGNHATSLQHNIRSFTIDNRDSLSIPFKPPFNCMTAPVVKLLNHAFYQKQFNAESKGQQLYESYFFPLDKLANWNVMYGRRGFYQYQFVVGPDQKSALRQILEVARQQPAGSFVTVLKAFGNIKSPGLMSFPSEGYTLTLDYPNLGHQTTKIFREFERILVRAGGRVYAAKDAVSSPNFFLPSYANAAEFKRFVDPKFSSSLWRRVNHAKSN
jgi:FAD/FMN-containing dehydrogenase